MGTREGMRRGQGRNEQWKVEKEGIEGKKEKEGLKRRNKRKTAKGIGE